MTLGVFALLKWSENFEHRHPYFISMKSKISHGWQENGFLVYGNPTWDRADSPPCKTEFSYPLPWLSSSHSSGSGWFWMARRLPGTITGNPVVDFIAWLALWKSKSNILHEPELFHLHFSWKLSCILERFVVDLKLSGSVSFLIRFLATLKPISPSNSLYLWLCS